MNFSRTNIKPLNITNHEIGKTESKIWLGLKKFWQFSLFYGDYLGSLHSKKKVVE